jgi:TonB-dependent SusC/RagA subfamily outer membrane receptor
MRNRNAAYSLTGVVALLTVAACGSRSAEPATPGATGQTGAVSTVTEANRAPGENQLSLEEFLRGQVPGLQFVRTPEGGLTLSIRGGSTVAEPLVVIDGAPVAQGQLGATLETLNPADISKVQVLKDVASTARWGARGAYGVLLITTRKR